MRDETDSTRLTVDNESLAGDALLQAVRRDMHSLFGLVKGLDTKVEALDAKVGAIDKRVDALDKKVDALDTKVDALDANVGALDTKVEALDTKVEALDTKVEALDTKVEALDTKVEAQLRDTTPMWELVISRLDTIAAEQASQGRRLDVIETELRQLRRRIEGMIAELSRDVVEVRAAQRDLEARIEKLEKPPA